MNPIDQTAFPLESLGQGQTSRTASKSLGQDQFLELMVAQMKNQDPLNPMQNGEFLGQLAQFGTVSGIQQLQSSFAQLSTALQSNQALMASSLVGRAVLVPGSDAMLSSGEGLSGAVNLPSASPEVVVGVYDASGQLLRRLSLGAQAAGMAHFSWDGVTDSGDLAPGGKYRIRAEAVIDGRATTLDTLVSARVDSISLGGAQGLTVNLAGLGPVAFSEIKQIG
jgi:flagellar basal-body rod modification protein FlgD